MIHTTTNNGLHDFDEERLLTKSARPTIRVVDPGTGPGAVAARLSAMGCEVLAVNRDSQGSEVTVPHISVDFGQQDFSSRLGAASFGIVAAVEVEGRG